MGTVQIKEQFNMEPYEFNILEKRKASEGGLEFLLIPANAPKNCLKCGGVNIVRHQSYERKIKDLPLYGEPVKLLIQGNRYRCRECNSTFVSQYESVDDNLKMTTRLKQSICEKALKSSLTDVAEEFDVGISTVHRLFRAYIEEKDRERRLAAPKVLGIDENHVGGKNMAIFTDLQNCCLLDMLENRKQSTLKTYLENLPGKEKVEVVVCDLYEPYRKVVREKLPQAKVVVDKFHVVQALNKVMEEERRRVIKETESKTNNFENADKWNLFRRSFYMNEEQRFGLERYFEAYPELRKTYWIKEEFLKIYYFKKYSDAKKVYTQWKSRHGKTKNRMYFEVLKIMENWGEEVFNYFDRSYTNAYTESINRIINHLAKVGNGCSFETLRGKAIYGTVKGGDKAFNQCGDISEHDFSSDEAA